jgi:hypothetical protein
MANDVARLILQHVECDNPDHIKRLYGDMYYRCEQLLIDQLRQAITRNTNTNYFEIDKHMFPYWKCVETEIMQDPEFTFELGETLIQVCFNDEDLRKIFLRFFKRYDLDCILHKNINSFGGYFFSWRVSWKHWNKNY